MSIVTNSEIIAYLGVDTYTIDIEFLHEGIEQMLKNETGKPLESATFTELYDGKGGYYRLELNQQPVTAVSRVSTDIESVIKIKNTTLSTSASVKVDSTNVTLDIDGSTDILPIVSYPTLSSLVTMINTLSAKGWVAEIYDTVYNAKQTSKLIARQIDVTSFETMKEYDYLYMGEPASFKVINNSIEAYFPYGSQNISVTYTAGSTPADIKLAVLQLVKSSYDRSIIRNADGIKSWKAGDLSAEYFSSIQEMPFIFDIIERNKKKTV